MYESRRTEIDDDSWIVSGPGGKEWWVLTPMASTLVSFMAAALALAFGTRGLWVWFAIVGGMLAIWSVAAAGRLWLMRARVAWDDARLLVERRGRVREYQQADVDGLAWATDPWFVSGWRMGDERTLILSIQSGSEATREAFVDRLPVGRTDPLAPLIQRLCRQRVDAARAVLRRGEMLKGDAWAWLPDGLQLKAPGGSDLPLVASAEVAFVQRVGREIRFWRRGDDRPWGTVPAKDRDAWLLEWLLREQIAAVSGDDDAQDDEGLGRIVFERRPAKIQFWSTFLLGATMVAIGLFLGSLGLARGIHALTVLGFGLLLIGAFVGLVGARVGRSVLHVYERGVVSQGLRGRRELRYEEVELFAFDVRRQRRRGRYVGMLYTLALACRQQPSCGVFHTETAPHELEEFEWLRDRVSETIAHRMAAAFARGERVAWTSELTFEAKDLLYKPKGWLRRWEAPLRIPYRSILDFGADEGWFHVWMQGEDRAVVKVATSSPNFYPGWLLLDRLWERFAATSDSAARSAESQSAEIG